MQGHQQSLKQDKFGNLGNFNPVHQFQTAWRGLAIQNSSTTSLEDQIHPGVPGQNPGFS